MGLAGNRNDDSARSENHGMGRLCDRHQRLSRKHRMGRQMERQSMSSKQHAPCIEGKAEMREVHTGQLLTLLDSYIVANGKYSEIL